jgi:hypothetical protein
MYTKEIQMSELKTEFLFEARILIQPAMDVGQGPDGHRMIFMHKSGHFKGPKLRGPVAIGPEYELTGRVQSMFVYASRPMMGRSFS